jgi:hypothetical protein
LPRCCDGDGGATAARIGNARENSILQNLD